MELVNVLTDYLTMSWQNMNCFISLSRQIVGKLYQILAISSNICCEYQVSFMASEHRPNTVNCPKNYLSQIICLSIQL